MPGTVAPGAKLTAGDVDGDLRDEAVIVSAAPEGCVVVTVYDLDLESDTLTAAADCVATSLTATGARVACADVDGDAIDEVITLTTGQSAGVLTRFDCDCTPVFSWTLSRTCPQPAKAQMGCAEVTGDAKSDVIMLVRRTKTICRLLLQASTGSSVVPTVYWQGTLPFGRTRFTCAADPPVHPKDTLHVLCPATVEALIGGEPDGTLTFQGHPFDVVGLRPGDVISARPAGILTENLFRKVTGVESTADQTLLRTAPAALDDAFDNVDVDFSTRLEQAVQSESVSASALRGGDSPSTVYPKWKDAPSDAIYFTQLCGWGPYAPPSATRPSTLKAWDGKTWAPTVKKNFTAPYKWVCYTAKRTRANPNPKPSGWYKCYYPQVMDKSFDKAGKDFGLEWKFGLACRIYLDVSDFNPDKDNGKIALRFYDRTVVTTHAKGAMSYVEEHEFLNKTLAKFTFSFLDICDVDFKSNLKVYGGCDLLGSAEFDWVGVHQGDLCVGYTWKKGAPTWSTDSPGVPGFFNEKGPTGRVKFRTDVYYGAKVTVEMSANVVFGLIEYASGKLSVGLKARLTGELDTDLIGSPKPWAWLDFAIVGDGNVDASILFWDKKWGPWEWVIKKWRLWDSGGVADTSPPTTTVEGADDAWHGKAVTLAFKADDGKGAGLNYTEFSTDGGATWTQDKYLTIEAPAGASFVRTVQYRSVDKASPANVEDVKTVTVKIDARPPTTTVAGVDDTWRYGPVTLTFSPADGAVGECSGVATTESCVDGGPWMQGVERTIARPGKHVVLYRSTDHVGNVSESSRCVVQVGDDTDSPVTEVTGADDAWHNTPVTLDFISHDTGGGWLDQTSGITATLDAVDCSDGDHAWAVGAGGAIVATADGGATWHDQTTGTTAGLRGVDFVDAANGWAVGDAGVILHTSNGGLTWQPQTSGQTAALNAVTFRTDRLGWAVGAAGTVLRTDDGGATWLKLTARRRPT